MSSLHQKQTIFPFYHLHAQPLTAWKPDELPDQSQTISPDRLEYTTDCDEVVAAITRKQHDYLARGRAPKFLMLDVGKYKKLAAWMSYLSQSLQLPEEFDGMTLVIVSGDTVEVSCSAIAHLTIDYENKRRRTHENNG